MPLYDDPRSSWTDYVPSGRVRIAPASRTGIRWHWSGNPTNLSAASSHASCLKLVLAWERYHMSKGWNSIGYNLLICPHARVIEGRGVDYRGAHSGSTADNAATYGVQLMVGTGELANVAMFDRAYYLERALWDHSGHTLTSSGHSDAPDASTECPGPQIYKWAHSTHTLSTQEDTVTQEQMDKILAAIAAVDEAVHDKPVRVGTTLEPLGLTVGRTYSQVKWATSDEGVAELVNKVAEAIVAKLPAPGTVVISREDLEAALRAVLGSVDGASPAAGA